MTIMWALLDGKNVLGVVEDVTDNPDYVTISWPGSGFVGIDVTNLDPMPSAGDVYDSVTNTFSTPPPTPIVLTIQQQIDILESTCTMRKLREAFDDPTWIKNLSAQIDALRAQIPTT